jgi:hypothetical protein
MVPKIRQNGGEDIRAMLQMPPQPPVGQTDGALVEQFAQASARHRWEMRIGKMRQQEHRLGPGALFASAKLTGGDKQL